MRPFVPETLPLQNIDWAALIEFPGNAHRELGVSRMFIFLTNFWK